MQHDKCFAVIGGDTRFAYLAGSLAADGFTVYAAGLEKANFCGDSVIMTDALTAVKMSAYIIFPLPATQEGYFLNAPYSTKPILLDDTMLELLKTKQVFAGMAGSLRSLSSDWNNLDVEDYYDSEELQISNALLTAEGALALALTKAPYILSGSDCLVTGYGRIGKIIADKLKALGAHVYVAARKSTDLAWIEAFGYTPLLFADINKIIRNIDIIFNTVPSLVITEGHIEKMKRSGLLIDLASKPGGIDFTAAEKYGVKADFAPGIPGKYSPLSAALIIKNTILSMIREA